jgi:hypothetical protein
VYVVQLIVNDGTVDSPPDTVTITTENSAPVADAGPDQTALVGQTVVLDGSASFDADGDPLTFLWSLTSVPSGSGAALSDVTAIAPTFDVDVPGSYVAQLIVNDGKVSSSPDTVVITTENSAPTANAGPDQSVLVGDTVLLDGGGSSDADGDSLTYSWSLTVVPAGSGAALVDATTATPTFVADVPGTYVVQLVVNDGTVDSAPDTVVVTTENSAPAANAGPDQSVLVGATVTLDGTASSDDDDDPLTYSWSFVSRPAGSTATLSGATSAQPTFVADAPGSYEIQLVVNDGTVDSVPDSAIVLASVPLTLTLSPETLNLLTFESGSLTVMLSAPAGPGGLTVAISVDNPLVSVPSSVLIPEGAAMNSFPVTAGAAEGSAIVSVIAGLLGDSSTVVVGPRSLALTTESPLVGVGRTIDGTVAIGQAAPPGGTTITLTSDDEGIATISPGAVTIPEGETSAPVTVDGISIGTTTLRANAAGFLESTAEITTTDFLVSIDNSLVVAPGQTSGLAVSLTKPSPPGGTTINFQSSDTGVAMITPSVFVPAGAFLPLSNPQVTGIAIGTITVTATAAGFAPDTRPVIVTIALSFSPSATTIPTGTTNIQLNLSAPAPAGGLHVDLSSDDTGVATVPSAVTVIAGQTSVQVPVTGVAPGATVIRASAPGIAEATANVTVGASINVNDIAVGDDLQGDLTGTLGAPAPAGGVTVTITSLDPTRVLVSTTETVPGSASVVVQVTAGTVAIPRFFVQGLADSGSASLQITAPGFLTDTSTVSLTPSGFRFVGTTADFTTTTFSSNTTLQIGSVRLVPTTLAFASQQALRAGLDVSVEVTSSDHAVGVVTTSPVPFTGGQFSVLTAFDPIGPGTTLLTVVAPSGFSTPSAATERTATVTAPDILLSFSASASFAIGNNLQRPIQVTLAAPPPSPVDVTLSVGSGSIATISDNATVAGGTSVTFPGVSGTTVGTIYVQGQSKGSTTIQGTAAGYKNHTSTALVTPSGFQFTGATADFTTTSFSANSTLQVSSVQLSSALTLQTFQEVRAGLDVEVSVTSSDTTVGVITASPLTFHTGPNSLNTQFDPINPGVTTLTVETPPGFDTPAAARTRTATVTAPRVFISGGPTGTFTVGDELQIALGVSLEAAPPSPVDVTVTIASGTIATVSIDPTLEGSTAVTFPGVTGTAVGTIYLQGRSIANTTMTGSATGYASGNFGVNVAPSGFRFVNIPASFETTTFSANKPLQVASVALTPTLAFAAFQSVRGGLTVDVELTSSVLTVGTITSPLVFGGPQGSAFAQFDPVTAGLTVLTIVTPSGFSTPNANTVLTATVRAPDILLTGGGNLGLDLQRSVTITLEAAPPQPVDVTVTSNAGAIATISTDGTVAGGTSLTFTGVTGTFVADIALQGRALGSTTLTAQASGYDDGSLAVNVTPSGFRFASGPTIDFSTTVSAPNTTLGVNSCRLNPTTLQFLEFLPVRGGLTVNVDVTSSNPSVGAITASPLVFTGGIGSRTTAFDPASTGTTVIEIEVPPGFSPPALNRVLTATVNP